MPTSTPLVTRPPRRFAGYPSHDDLVARFRAASHAAGGTESIAGTSVEGRPLLRWDLGTAGKKAVLLTALMHGIEVIGSLALLDVIERLSSGTEPARLLLDNAHIVVLPIVNPDAYASNMGKIAAGGRAWQRCNANGVDLNRNFPRLSAERMLHPFSGSSFRASPHYLGPHALSEPESRAVHAAAVATQPCLSLAFHSFGEMLLYPWAYSARPNERAAHYQLLASAMASAIGPFPYRARQARQLYPVLGDMDDWLDAHLGTLALTVEVSRPDLALRDGRQLLNPFCWMNPEGIRETLDNLTPGVLALVACAIEAEFGESPGGEKTERPSKKIELAAK
ncbi:MAG: M14 family metallopeptidase [Polyangiaceae bacterium]